MELNTFMPAILPHSEFVGFRALTAFGSRKCSAEALHYLGLVTSDCTDCLPDPLL
jgi:hypothetical protein